MCVVVRGLCGELVTSSYDNSYTVIEAQLVAGGKLFGGKLSCVCLLHLITVITKSRTAQPVL